MRRFFRLPATAARVGEAIDEEIGFHLRERTEALIASGVSPMEARRRAEREFGDVALARAELGAIDRVTVRRVRRAQWWDGLATDVRHAVGGLRRDVAFACAVVLTLALGIGVNAGMFGIADRLLLRAPAHVRAADELVRVLYRRTPRETGELTTSATLPYFDYAALRDGVPGLRAIAAYSTPWFSVLGRGLEAAEIRVVYATSGLFATLGVRPALGRFFTEAEDVPPRGRRVVVVSHGLWQGRFGGDPAVLGRMVEIDHAQYEVIGVAPRGFAGIDLEPVHAWVPVSAVGADFAGDDWHLTRNMYWLAFVARLAPDVNAESTRQQATAVFRAANEEQFGRDTTAGIVFGSVIAARAPAVGIATPQRSGRIALWLLGVSLLVLVVACANVANLLLARGMQRRRDAGVRLAIGASRGRLARQVLVETLVLALAGCTAGLVLAHFGGRAARVLLLPDVEWTGGPLDERVLAFATLLGVGSVLLAGIAPALHAARGDAVALLRAGGRSTYRRSLTRRGLVGLQATLSVVLLVGAGLFVRSLHNAATLRLGFDADRVATFQWHTNGLGWDAVRARSLYEAGLERVRALPEVEAAALGVTVPMWSALYASIRLPGQDSAFQPPGDGPYHTPVSPDYFRTVGARIVRGRAFDTRDVAGSAPVSIVTAALARRLWPGEEAVGKCLIHLDVDRAVCRDVVGVVEDTRYHAVEGDPSLMLFSPIAQVPLGSWRTLFVRPRGDHASAIPAVRRALAAIEPDLPHVRVQLLATNVGEQIQPWRLGATLFTAFGVLALLLSGLGLYGVIAYDVAQRRRELGIRLAVGARARTLVRMVLGDASGVLLLGLAAGLAVAGWTAGRIEPLLFDVSPRDPVVLAAVAAALLLLGLAAAAIPAWRAARTHPTEALRED